MDACRKTHSHVRSERTNVPEVVHRIEALIVDEEKEGATSTAESDPDFKPVEDIEEYVFPLVGQNTAAILEDINELCNEIRELDFASLPVCNRLVDLYSNSRNMGGNQSKVAGGGVRRQVEPLVPRSWAELVQLHLRFQQEAHRRKADPLFQYFLTFPVFQTIVAPLCPTKNKTQLMAIFAALDRKNAQKLAVMDFFSGLALLVDAKKPQKLECAAAAGGFWLRSSQR
ncbi:hypothetical protein BBJ28_00005863 [Nothophytophthora sp. Chile5]|nr:hypothetical protein BBJ28_00005863 [Nothophytophthora sp. Chile5]